ncbi:MAG TPA: ACT domain-containing protein [Verrucomicrobiota bacterium]|nr:ACT domain-containing protein [Verrucomicrobiota bacterium]HNU51338.1 ACT domain-containing protein [Verrucomicrobiota bacterium]
MQVPRVLTLVSRDRPGIVELLARIVADHGGNWLESRMCRLGGEFAGILRIHIPAEQEPALRHTLNALRDQGLTVEVHAAESESPAPRSRATLELVGHDRPGIVREVSATLARHGVNVDELTTECSSAPMTGEPLFKARARLHLPDACDRTSLQQELERIASNLLVDLDFDSTPPAS